MQKTRRQRSISRLDSVLSLKHGAVRITYDREADAAYFYLKKIKKGEAVKTVALQPWLLADLDKKGTLLGLEMLFVSDQRRHTGVRSKKPAIMAVPALV